MSFSFLSFCLSFLPVSVSLYGHADRVSDQNPGGTGCGQFLSAPAAGGIWVSGRFGCTFCESSLALSYHQGIWTQVIAEGELPDWDSPQTDALGEKRGRGGGKGPRVFPIFRLT